MICLGGYGCKSGSSYGGRVRRQSAFKAGRKAAIKEGWKPFTKMTKTQHHAFVEGFHAIYP